MSATVKKVTRMRGVVMAAVLALFGALLIVVANPTAPSASAHGTPLFPESRTYACYLDGVENGEGGGLNPQNPKCAAALSQYGNYAFYNWFGNLLSNADGQHRQVVADGELCGPADEFAGMRPGGTDWPTTQVSAGQNITFRYSAWAAHPGKFMQYVTKDGWDPSQPLKWSDLEAEPFDVAVDPPKQDGPEGAEYYWNATLPSDKQGRHIIYSIWERSDSPEAFYSCSDVMFDGEPQPEPTETETPEPEPTETTPEPEPTETTPEPEPTETTPVPSGDCSAVVSVVNSWDGGYQADVEVMAGANSISGWEVTVSGATITQAWNASVTGNSFTNVGWNGSVGAGGSTNFGFIGSGQAESFSATCTTG